MVAEETERDIDATRLEYVPVAVRTQILFFCVSDLSNVDPMYQYSLEWFLGIFMAGIANSERAGRAEAHTNTLINIIIIICVVKKVLFLFYTDAT